MTIADLTAREYQIELFEKAIDENTIIYLPTGSGKTFIAVKLVMKLSASIQSPFSKGGKRTIFIVNTVPLVGQQSEYLSRHTGLKAKGFSGDMNVDYWTKETWLNEIEDSPILVMVAQIFVDIINHGVMSLDRVNLIVFDECHRAVSDHPMRQIMQRFEACPEDDRPRVLGLSATLLNSNVKSTKLEKTIESLEITFHAKVASVKSLSIVAGFSTNPRENIIEYKPSEMSIFKKVEQIIEEVKNMLKITKVPEPSDNNLSSAIFKPKPRNEKLINILSDIMENLQLTGVFGGNKAILLHMIQLESIKKDVIETATVFILEYIITKLMILRKLFDKEMDGLSLKEQIYSFSSDKLMKLISILKKFNDEKDPEQKFCCIIFVQRRFTAQVLYHILKSLHQSDDEYKFLLPEFIVGYNNDPFRSVKESQCIAKWNKEVLKKFRNGKSNCIVATDVVDEGVDIPQCTLIVRFDLPQDFRSYIQSKGRARHSSSQYTIMKSSEDDKFMSKYVDFQLTEKYLQKFLIGKTDFRKMPLKEDIAEELYTYTIEPFLHYNMKGQPCVITEQSAIGLVNRYCANLYKSKFISLSPTWTLHKGRKRQTDVYQVSLQLPIISALKEIIWGDPMESIDEAKRSVAMKTCIRLKQVGELNDNLIPVDPNLIQENLEILFPNWVDEKTSENYAPGTYSVKRKHNLVHPEQLYAAFPKKDTVSFLHIVNMKPTYSVPHDNRLLVLYNLLKSNSGFGIITSKPFPNIPSFPIFMNVGVLEINVKVNYSEQNLNDKQIKSIKIFHTMVFNDILSTIKDFMVFDNSNLENSFAVVPVNEKWNIDWDIVQKYQSIEKKAPPPPFEINESEYELALVTPTYRGSQSVYIVTSVCDDISADSSFPTNNFHSYIHYYKDRHGVTIENAKQQLLEVKPISSKINFIRPRSSKSGISKRRRTEINDLLVEHLVPELCDTINFPALYWLKATTLPSVLHRITQFLIAEDLRLQILKEARVKIQNSPKTWSPLVINDLEIEEKKETSSDVTLDESVELDVSDLQPEVEGPEIDVLNLESEYSWPKEEEPVDLIREADRIQLIDIEYFHKFVGQDSIAINKSGVNIVKPKQGVTYMPRPSMSVPVIKMLTQKDFEGLNPVILMKAVTSKMGNDCFDLERMETLGDSFLKFAVSLFLYESFKNYNEGQLTALKGKLIGNRNLYYCGVSKNIPGRMKIEEFSPLSNFIAPAFTAERDIQTVLIENEISPNVLYELKIPPQERSSGFISESTLNAIQEKVLAWNDTPSHTGMEHFLGMQTVSDKVVSDSVEAIIGACLCTLGTEDSLNILKWFGVIPKTSTVEVKSCQISSNSLTVNEIIRLNDHMPWANALETRLNYKFNDRSLLLQAFSHPSYSVNGLTPCYQRLEFLGDAILDFLITVYIYEYCGELSPGDLTDLRSALVNNITFACVAVRYGLHTALLAYVPLLHETINRFVKFQEERNHAVDVELLWILLEEEECNLAEHVDVPKALGDIFESFIGAVYIDSGKDLLKVWEIVYTMMHKEFELFCSDVPKQPVRVIYETPGARPRFMKAKKIDGTGQVMIPLEVTVHGKNKLFHGFGANKKQAKSAASKLALKFFRVNK